MNIILTNQLVFQGVSIASYGIYLLAQLLFHLFWAPGLTFWNALIGYFMVNKFEAFCVVYIPSCLSCFLTDFIAKYMFKNWCLKRVLNNKFFKAFFEESIEILRQLVFFQVCFCKEDH